MIRQKEDQSPAAVEPQALAQRTAAKAGVDDQTAAHVIGCFLAVCKEGLLSGERIDLGGLMDLGVVVEPARIRRDQTGRFSEIAPARSRLDVSIGGELRDRLAGQRTAAILLAMPRKDKFGEILSEHFSKLGWQVQRAESLDKCHELVQGARPYLLVCDHNLEARQDLVRQIKTGWSTNPVPVVTLHKRLEDLKHPDSLSVLGDLAVFEPISVHPFLRAMDQVLAQSSEESAVFERQIHYRLPVVEDEIVKGFALGEGFFRDAGFSGDALVALSTAFREAVRNAEVHGSASNPKKSIDIEMLLDREKLTVSVEDEGNGFDHRSYRDRLGAGGGLSVARERHAAGGVGGLGIYLMNRCTDRLEYNDRGSRVTLTKYREPVASGRAR